ncbi:hypothetical protein PoB_007570500 [Plakobranchus ocellatus]|uniref:Uncharacterized protein n=1 Tax=Plakobranchus ocellatus TaxID=259542 RepID=A0AAV4DYR3_9GAST|nr:hypothetical protein PoB_007570500 [Plakobranchus ocellatus]
MNAMSGGGAGGAIGTLDNSYGEIFRDPSVSQGGVGGAQKIANPAGDLQGPFRCGFDFHYQRLGLMEGLKA